MAATIDRAVRTGGSVSVGRGPAALPAKFFDTVKAGGALDVSTGTYTAASNGVASVTFRSKVSGSLSGLVVKPALLHNGKVVEFGDDAGESETDIAAVFQVEVVAGDQLQLGVTWANAAGSFGGSVSLTGDITGEDTHVEFSLAS